MEIRSKSPSTKSLDNLGNNGSNSTDSFKAGNSSSKNNTGNSSQSTGSSTPERPMNQLLNNMGNRVMTKPKYGGFCMNLQQKMKNSSRCLLILGIIFLFTYISVYFLEVSPKTVSVLSKDRGTDYNVKVLPASLSDEELDKLPKDTFSYLAMIDAGSSGCRAHIYRYGKLGTVDGPLYILPQHKSLKVKPGLSSFANNPDDAGPSLKGLIDFMKEQVPESDWKVTPIWLKATAGLRMLPTATTDAILTSVRAYLGNIDNSPFLFRANWARVIPGNEEGGFGWIAFNYLKRVIGPKRPTNPKERSEPYAVIEMGGASAQVSQLAPSLAEAEKIPPDYRFSFTIEGEDYHLYTHSYLGYGAEQAKEQYRRLLETKPVSHDPCKHEGLPAGKSRRRLQQHSRHLQASSDNNSSVGILPPAVAATMPANQSIIKESLTTTPTTSNGNNRHNGLTCPRNVASLFTSAVSNDKCTVPGPHSFGCVYQPAFVAQSSNILAFENFFYMSSALGVKPVSQSSSQQTTFPLETTPNLIREASEAFCSLPWKEVEAQYPKDGQPKDVNQKSCFISAFSYAFLVHGLKIPADKKIIIQREVGASEIEWALGAAYKETADLLKRTHLRPT